MTGLETAALRAAGAAASRLWSSRLGQVPGAGLTDRPVRPVPHWQRPTELGGPELRRLAERLADRLGEAVSRLPEHERLAALDAVADAFTGAGRLDADALFAADLDPSELAAKVPVPAAAGLGPAAEAACRDLIRLVCVHAAEYLTTLPSFGARADVELVRRTGELQRTVDRLAERADGADRAAATAHAFEERYAAYIAQTHGRLQLFGLTTGRTREEWPLDLAYISLTVSGEAQLPMGEQGVHQTAVRAEHALGSADRVLLRGPAGSGKSTLVQWLALHTARRSAEPWRTCVPFVLRLRSFTAAENLPLPDEFLKASGVPLSAPAGWTEELMHNGQALVLVDGVDEVPQRLRTRTELWLRSLVTAFPKARYVVTTRPSAVPEDWLAGQGFTSHSLLPMEREDIRAFVTHWHAAARAEGGPAGEDIDAYEASLLEAVGSRRDLGRLATNPLMCALLCALNRDRRMHLPRARKELYDAALDMLLVRRDTEREISGVEGVYLTRDEQILLLQRFAYWLIRNEQVEASRDEAVELVEEWLDAMPQVRQQGDAAQVFSHLLIRSGLLREPVKGAVDFVHRTFQDYLGAKAAVESRDFGVLVKHAHDDTWDDVVRMAVGHARPDERMRILRGLLRRADRVKGTRSRLVLLAAACLEHAPELDPAIRTEVETLTAELLPPRSLEQAEELAKAGELVLELLPDPASLSEDEAAAVIRTAALIGGPRALAVIEGFRTDNRYEVAHQVAESWGRFPPQEYADVVLSGAAMSRAHLHIRTREQLMAFSGLPHIRRVHLTWSTGIPSAIIERLDLEWLVIHRNTYLSSLALLAGHHALKHLGVFECPSLVDLEPIGTLSTESLALVDLAEGLSLAPLAAAGSLERLVIGFEPRERRIGDVPAAAGLTSLSLWQGARKVTLDGLGQWPEVKMLTISGTGQYQQLVREVPLPGLTGLQIIQADGLEVGSLTPHQGLTRLLLGRCVLKGSLEALRTLPSLTRLRLRECTGDIDLSSLADLDALSFEIDRRTVATGIDRIPPERLTRIA
ncbi:NACHT domain-containing protein [Streptomyces sp. NPDC101206]|uniref:NACHT domain-containing protein n=1 Tax=Streptomyces sp. NPDC101206 TaxID=3366128 RepID=UPI003825F3AA